MRFKKARIVKEFYISFDMFAIDFLDFLGFDITPMQLEIARSMDMDTRKLMVQAPRGEGKTFLAAANALYRLIHNPSLTIMIVSAIGDKAEEIATLIYKVLNSWDVLDYLRPDSSRKDLDSTKKFDVHWALKGINQSASISSRSITSALAGKRADLVISDDIENTTNSDTAGARDKLEIASREFSAIVTHGSILYLGTPQSKDSIYNRLPSKGYTVVVYTARYPTQADLAKYDGTLAPYIRAHIEADPSLMTGGGIDGTKGKPVDPKRYDEEALIEKEVEWGAEGFELQYMLNTELSDAVRQQLKVTDLVLASFGGDTIPDKIAYSAEALQLATGLIDYAIPNQNMYRSVIPSDASWVDVPKDDVRCYLDPAGGGTDELAWAIGYSIGTYVHASYVGGVRGGLSQANTDHILENLVEYEVSHVRIETNMGHGLFELNFQKSIEAKIKEWIGLAALEDRGSVEYYAIMKKADILSKMAISSEFSTTQKEKRIIDSLVSTMQRHLLVIHNSLIEADKAYCLKHGIGLGTPYSMFYQLANITTDRGSLKHDDRLECLAGLVRLFKGSLREDAERVAEEKKRAEVREFMANPMGYKEKRKPSRKGTRHRLR